MAEDSESAASQQSLELDDQDTCGIDGDNEEENEHMQGWGWPVTVTLFQAACLYSVCVLGREWLAQLANVSRHKHSQAVCYKAVISS